ncbi:MAG: hypothetical protein V3S03_08470 [Vicinamibacteria bacterium]
MTDRLQGPRSNSAGVSIVPGRVYVLEGDRVRLVGRQWKSSEGWRGAIEPLGRGICRNVFVDELEDADQG